MSTINLIRRALQKVNLHQILKKRVSLPIILGSFLLLLIIVASIFYILIQKNAPQSNVFQTIAKSTPEPTESEVIANSSPSDLSKLSKIRFSDVILTYPSQWIPILTASQSTLYFAKNQQEAQYLLRCVITGNCRSYSLQLSFDHNSRATNLSKYVEEYESELQFNKLKKITIGGRESWIGYTADKPTQHQLIITTELKSKSKGYTLIFAKGTSEQMMEEYVSLLPSMAVVEERTPLLPASKDEEYNGLFTKGLSIKKGYIVNFTSSFITEDKYLADFFLRDLLAPQNSVKNYNYFLYGVKGTRTSKVSNNVTMLDWPKDNYLNSKYYLLTDNNELQDGVYGTEQIRIKLSTPSENLGLYLADPKYCQVDSDCQYRANFCSKDAFNAYHRFGDFGCGGTRYGNLGDDKTLTKALNCEWTSFDPIEVKYDSIKCINNSCQAVNAKPSCRQK